MTHSIDLFQLDMDLLTTPDAQQARHEGVLRAKSEALKTAQHLVAWGRPLLFSVLVVSFVHVLHGIAAIKPAGIPALDLPPWMYHGSAGLLTLAVDAVAWYLVSTRSVAAYAGDTRHHYAVWFYYVLTALLNGTFVFSHMPGLPDLVQVVLPGVNLLTGILLALLIPVSIAAVESAHQTIEAARLALLIECSTLRGIVGKRSITEAAAMNRHRPPGEPGESEMLSTDTPYLNGHMPGIMPGNDQRYTCPNCDHELSLSQHGAARRWGHCLYCKDQTEKNATHAK
jgi:hypothetical protein